MSKILVLIQLIGGNDSLNTIIPAADLSLYHKKRPTIGLKDEDMLKLTDDLFISKHAQPIQQLYNEGKVAVINGVGYANQNFSHFRSTDIHMSAVPQEVNDTGFIGRALDSLVLPLPPDHPPALKIGQGSSMLFRAGKSWGVSITSPEKFYQLINDVEYVIPPSVYSQNLGFIRGVINQSQQYADAIGKAYYAGSGNFGLVGSLSDQLEIVAKLITGGLQTPIYHVTLDGFDTHALQFDTHNNLISQLAYAVDDFMSNVNGFGMTHDVTVMTFSEFGRRTFENESRGTDHGAASTQFIFGKNLNPGVYGQIKGLDKDNLEVEFDFRSIYADVLDWMGADDKAILFGDYHSDDFINQGGIIVPPPTKKERYRMLDLQHGRKITLYDDKTWEEGTI